MHLDTNHLRKIARNIRQMQDRLSGKEWTPDMRENFVISEDAAIRLYDLFQQEDWKTLFPPKKKLYLIGSLRNAFVPELAKELRQSNPEVEIFDDWYAAGFEADDMWKSYEKDRGRSYNAALEGYAAKHVFEFDKHHLDTSTHVLLVLPAGKSGHMELMYGKYGVGAKAAILLEQGEDPRWDVMYQFVDHVFSAEDEVKSWLNQ